MQLITVSKSVKQKFNRIAREIKKNYTVTIGDFNIFPCVIGRSSRSKLSKDRV